ncbi:MAG: protein kinase [Deltaproteobacteria bacterium]|nr:protein kinase [Deltaproteobacteria bacterium]
MARDAIFRVGELLAGVYEIRALLGEGAMGQVFEARDHDLDRRVAIKAAWPGLGLPSLRKEARALAAFRHPSLVTVHTLGEHRGAEFLVMERIYGVSLEAHMDHRFGSGEVFSVDEVVALLVSLAEGLAVVHRAGLAHRDVKPANVMLTPDHRVVLMDFGLVLPEFEIAAQTSIAGSPSYMAPEALENTVSAGAGHLTDVYGLGVVAFELLTGQLPYDADTLTKLWELQRSGPNADVLALRPDVPVPLAKLVKDALHSVPADRPQSAEAFAWQLEASLRREARVRAPTLPPPPIDLLVVEDDADMARILSFYAKQELGNVHARRAVDGVEAIAMVRERAPDVMLLDLHMPKMNGVEVLMQMRGERLAEGAAVIAVSAGAQRDDLELLHQLGIHHFVSKGQDLKQKLAEALRGACGRAVVARDVSG